MEIPKKIREAAKWYSERYGERIKYLATEKDKAIYYFAFPDNCDVGFPVVYLFDGSKIDIVQGIDACKIISKYISQ